MSLIWQSLSASDMRTSHVSRDTDTPPSPPSLASQHPEWVSPLIFWRQNPRGALNVVPPFNNQRNIFLTPLSLMSSRHHWVAIMYPLVTEEEPLVLFSRLYLRSLAICRQMCVKILPQNISAHPKFIFTKSSAQGLFLYFPEIFLTLAPPLHKLTFPDY